MRQLFANDTCYEVPIGHHECITLPPPHYQEENRRSSVRSNSSNSGSSTMINESPRPTHPSSRLMISHSIAMREATTALEKLIAVEVQMEEDNLRILDTVETGGAGFVPSLAVGDHAYCEIALRAAVAGHGRLRATYWRVVQIEERSGLGRNDLRENPIIARPMGEENRKLGQVKKDLEGPYQDLGRRLDTQTIGTIVENQVASGMKPQHSLEMRQYDAGLLSGDYEPPQEEITATFCNYIQPEFGVQLQGPQEDDGASQEAKTDECARKGIRCGVDLPLNDN